MHHLNKVTERIQFGILDDYPTIRYHQLKDISCTPEDIINTLITASELKSYVISSIDYKSKKSSLSYHYALEYIDLCDFEAIASEQTIELHQIAISDYESLNC